MSHLNPTYSSFSNFLENAQSIYSVNLAALNSSGVTGTAIFAIGQVEETGEQYLNVSIAVEGMEAGVAVPQHIHGLFDGMGNPVNSTAPDINSDTDNDGAVEVLEGLASYGDVLLPLTAEDGSAPMTNANGNFTYIRAFDLNDASNFFSPVSNTDYDSSAILPLTLRELVLHGVNVPAGNGAGTPGEVNGMQDGFVPILPAAAGEIETTSFADAMAILDQQKDVVGADVMVADDATTPVEGTEGNDVIGGGAGDDVASGMDGDDTLTGADGNDMLTGGAGSDVIDGDAGNDLINAGADDNNAFNKADMGASGSLRLTDYDNGYAGGAGDDVINGGDGDDIITGDDDSRVSTATGGLFDVTADGADTIFGGAGNDEIHTGTWSDSDDGLPNAQTGMTDDVAFGGAGNDILRGAGGNDALAGNEGDDNIGGGGGNDTIGSGAGNDIASGGSGDDSIGGGAGNDTLNGDAGDDILGGGVGNDMVSGGDGNDIVNGGDGDDIVAGNGGHDTMGAGSGNDIVTGDEGDDNIGGGLGDDTIDGGAGNDMIGGGFGNDVITAGEGDDFVAGGAGDDQIDGSAGADRINAGSGNDMITGGAGDDTFIFNQFTQGEVDTVTDFEAGSDMLRLSGVNGGFDALTVLQGEGNATVVYEGHNIILEGVDSALVTEDFFTFI